MHVLPLQQEWATRVSALLHFRDHSGRTAGRPPASALPETILPQRPPLKIRTPPYLPHCRRANQRLEKNMTRQETDRILGQVETAKPRQQGGLPQGCLSVLKPDIFRDWKNPHQTDRLGGRDSQAFLHEPNDLSNPNSRQNPWHPPFPEFGRRTLTEDGGLAAFEVARRPPLIFRDSRAIPRRFRAIAALAQVPRVIVHHPSRR